MKITDSLLSSFDIGLTKQLIKKDNYEKLAKKEGIDTSEIFNKYGNIEETSDNTENLKALNEDYEKLLGSSIATFGASLCDSKVEEWLSSDNKCTDGKDDGKISTWSKIGNFFEGIGKTVAGAINSIAHDPKKIIGIALGGIATALLMTNPVGMAIVATLGILGGAKLVQGGIERIIEANKAAKEATTDEEAKDAWEEMGSGSFETGVGVITIITSGKVLTETPVSIEQITTKEGILESIEEAFKDPGNLIDEG